MPKNPPWAYSPDLGQYVWNPRTDMITTKTGKVIPRPPTVPRAALQGAIWEGPLPPYNPDHDPGTLGTSPTAGGYGLHPGPANSAGRSQASQQQANQPQRSNVQTNKGKGPATQTQGLTQGMQGMNLNATQGSNMLSPPKGARVSFATQPSDPSKPWLSIDANLENVTATLFPEFKIQPSRFFQRGRVFLVLWSEPAGNSGSSKAGSRSSKAATGITAMDAGITLNHFGEKVFSKVRRFVVIREGRGYCSALPITSYGGRGVAKRGVVKSDHCVIHTGRAPPAQTSERPGGRNEDGMRSKPIQMDPDLPTNTLDTMSRLNLASVMTVQHNLKVKPFGMVNARSMQDLVMQFGHVWAGRPVPILPEQEEDDDDDEEDEDDENDEDDDDDDDE